MSMIRLRKRNTAWLAALAVLTTIGMIASAPLQGALVIQIMLLAIFAIAGVASTVELGRERETLLDALKRAPIRQRVSPQAKEAGERARSHGGFSNNDMMLLDVGLIALQTSYEGMAMRRTRSISKDDDGARPFVTLNIDAAEADRAAVVRFEIYNQYGDQQFVHEMRSFLREGEMSIMTDHHLPLAGNQQIEGSGDWDLRVYIDGNLVALHNFMLAPSINERQRRLQRQEVPVETVYEVIDEPQQEIAPRLQDLLQNKSSASPAANSTAERPRTTRRRR